MEAATTGTTTWSSAARPPWSGCAASPAFEDASARAEGYVDQAVELTQEALGNVASQTRAVGERAAKLVGIELPEEGCARQEGAPAKKAGSGQEGAGQEGPRQEGAGQEGHPEVVRSRRRPATATRLRVAHRAARSRRFRLHRACFANT